VSPETLNRLRRAAAICFGLAIITGSLSQSVAGLPFLSDKAQHFLSYAGWMALIAASPRSLPRILSYAGVVALIGLAVEGLQPFVGRERSLYDLLANLAGIAAGFSGGLVLRAKLYGSEIVSRRIG